jgi:hypothetical protein
MYDKSSDGIPAAYETGKHMELAYQTVYQLGNKPQLTILLEWFCVFR